ncbi:MAG: glycerate kinase [Tissierellaceae bacterium]
MKRKYVILLAPDSFKESMTAKEACQAMERGIKKANKDISCIHVPMADGGEGTMESLVDATGGKIYRERVMGPLGDEVEASYGILGDGETGVVEMASASGLHLLPVHKRNPMITSTYGTGQLIRACLDRGIKRLLIGIGGSATNDGGLGAIQALGGSFVDSSGNELGHGGGELGRLHTIDLKGLDRRLQDIELEVACDVNNPLCGITGASHVFGPQKGANPEMIEVLDRNLKHYGNIIKEQVGKDVLNVPGSGAAGGLGAGLLAFLNGRLTRGIDMVIKYSGLEDKLALADMVWTGEGSIDFQTQYGKTPMGVAQLAKKYHKPVIGLAGKIGDKAEILYDMGIDSLFSIGRDILSLEEALKEGPGNLEKLSENIVRLMNIVWE